MTEWRIIELQTHDAFMNMALDEAACEFVKTRQAPPTIRFYRWRPSAVSIGYFQSLDDEVAVNQCKAERVDFIRRRTGGGAVYHDYEGEITYSVITPESTMPKGILDSYRLICGWLINALSRIGVESEFKPINDIVEAVSGKKISGNAQTRRGGVLLQHGTLLYKVDVPKMFSFLKVGQEKIADKLIAAVTDRVTSINILKPALSMEDVYAAMFEGFTSGKKWVKGDFLPGEMKRASELVKERYSRDEWNNMK
jgi:lipoate-protein ligase A